MKLTMPLPRDNKVHTYCLGCTRETLRAQTQAGKLTYRCTRCNHASPRALIIDPAISWWTDDTREYWHETGGIFLRNARGEFLLFERMTYPFGLAVPAGHVDRGEKPLRTAQRELGEETAVKLPGRAFRHIATDDIRGDKCRRGADIHRWHSFVCSMPPSATIKVDPREGSRPVWLTLDKALQRNLTFATRSVIVRHHRKILTAAQ